MNEDLKKAINEQLDKIAATLEDENDKTSTSDKGKDEEKENN